MLLLSKQYESFEILRKQRGVTHYKLVDTYDYRKIRTPLTPLTEIEQGYCYNDVRGLCECIRAARKENNLAEIPLPQQATSAASSAVPCKRIKTIIPIPLPILRLRYRSTNSAKTRSAAATRTPTASTRDTRSPRKKGKTQS